MTESKVDVLAWIRNTPADNGWKAKERDAVANAVTELIEADRDFDAAEAAWREAQINSTGDESPGSWRKEADRCWQWLGRASIRRRAALAACTPAKGEESNNG